MNVKFERNSSGESLKKKIFKKVENSYLIKFKKLSLQLQRFLLDADTKELSTKRKHTETNISFDSRVFGS